MVGSYTQKTRMDRARLVWDWCMVVWCCGMFVGMVFSRALLSFCMFALFATSLYGPFLKENFKRWSGHPFSWCSLAFWVSYLVSGMWSEDKSTWLASVINKVPFAIMPFAVLAVPFHITRYRRAFIGFVYALLASIVVYSLIRYGFNRQFYLEGYHMSVSLPTTKYNDHIRFSLSLVMAIVMGAYLIVERDARPMKKIWKSVLVVCSMLFLVYLHMLAAKTGIVCFYLLAIVYSVVRLARYNKVLAFVFAMLWAGLPFLAYRLVPTFRTKVDYVGYEIHSVRHSGHFDYTLSDAGRMITYYIGYDYIKKHPLLGSGAGDLMREMRKGYEGHYPDVPTEQQYGPTNQFMYTAMAIGIPLSLALLAMVSSSFFLKSPHRIYLVMTSLAMSLSLMVEAMLELQFGVFVYLFFILFWMSALGRKEPLPRPV